MEGDGIYRVKKYIVIYMLMPNWKKNLYLLWVTQVISLISFGFGLPFIPLFIEELGVTSQDQINLFTGILSMAPAVTMAIMAPVWGIISDKYGRKLMILRAMFTAVFIIGGMGFVSNVYTLIALRVAQGFFTGTVTASSAFIAANTPKDKLSSALGLMSSSTFIGYSIGPAIGGIIAKYAGYRVSFIAGGFIMLIGALIVLFFIKEDKSTYGQAREHIQRTGKTKLLTPLIISFLIMLFLQRMSRSIFTPYMTLFIKSIHGEENLTVVTGFISLLVGFATAISGLVFTRMGDKMSKSKLLVILISISLILSIIMTQGRSLEKFVTLYALLFLFLGGVEPLITSYTAQLTPSSARGRLFGLQGMVGSLGWMASPLLGAYLSIQYNYFILLWSIPVILTINFFIALGIQYYKKKYDNTHHHYILKEEKF